MLGTEYWSYQYYTYQDIILLKKILKVDQVGFVKIYEDEKIIEYQIDRSQHLRLSDLIQMIKANYAKIKLGQLIQLFLNLINQVLQLQISYQIEHQYLDVNRIWLIFNDPNQIINVFPNKIKYSIGFTGYQCQLYEDSLHQIKPAQKEILQIIKDILIDFKSSHIFFNDSKKNQILKLIYDPIIQECDKFNIYNTQNVIIEILCKQDFDNEQQSISLDDIQQINNCMKQRKITKKYCENCIKYFIDMFKEQQSYFIEKILMQNMKNLVAILDDQQQPQDQNDILQHQILNMSAEKLEKLQQHFESQQSKLKNNLKQSINQLLEDILENQMKNFKLQISEEEKQKLLNNLLDRIVNMKFNKYFYNSIYFSKKQNQQDFQQYQESLITKFSTEIVTKEVEMLIQYKILLLIDELI
ncbi:unnamed protein product [Paramecium sonneborni]|uniref:Uncharacterized protein n=1 Tax=Paramecium sonneborni TaxID=65129 RepID=A0A8S1RHY4_9CILI|nr:unnamed protein product [Paramecium sonneborni]